uniref:Uncharacterized protein n=1 Tax=Cynoglossus semilaevis TaxID=244447 RepID=A0A3P8V0U3_CYNSE
LVIRELYLAWNPDPESVWASGQVVHDYSPAVKQLQLKLCDGKVADYPVASLADLQRLANPDILEGENDFMSLSFLHEIAVLHNVRVRFLEYNGMYTYCGEQKQYEQLHTYGEEVMDAYSGGDRGDKWLRTREPLRGRFWWRRRKKQQTGGMCRASVCSSVEDRVLASNAVGGVERVSGSPGQEVLARETHGALLRCYERDENFGVYPVLTRLFYIPT